MIWFQLLNNTYRLSVKCYENKEYVTLQKKNYNGIVSKMNTLWSKRWKRTYTNQYESHLFSDTHTVYTAIVKRRNHEIEKLRDIKWHGRMHRPNFANYRVDVYQAVTVDRITIRANNIDICDK